MENDVSISDLYHPRENKIEIIGPIPDFITCSINHWGIYIL